MTTATLESLDLHENAIGDDDIRDMVAQIQSEWSDDERQRRAALGAARREQLRDMLAVSTGDLSRRAG